MLLERGVDVEVYRYLDEGIDATDLHLLASLEGIVRSKDAGKAVMAKLVTDEDTVALLKEQPKLLERPVLIVDGKAVIGRPPEGVLSLLE